MGVRQAHPAAEVTPVDTWVAEEEVITLEVEVVTRIMAVAIMVADSEARTELDIRALDTPV